MNAKAVVKVLVVGKVQGVFFRQSTRQAALALGLCGYVRNLDDGSVEAVFCGEKHEVSAILDFCRSGPPRARVDSLEVSWLSPEEIETLEVKPSHIFEIV